VGNYPGVTVERREGDLEIEGRRLRVIDLPGTYSLTPISPDEAVVGRVIAGELGPAPDALLLVADACTLERSLLMIAQVLRRGVPTCLVLTMTDELHARGGVLDLACLERALGIPVRGVVGHRGLGLAARRALLAHPEAWSRPPLLPPEPADERAPGRPRCWPARSRAGRGRAAPARRSTGWCCIRWRGRCSSRR
jgi:ferrous iron transport protein B